MVIGASKMLILPITKKINKNGNLDLKNAYFADKQKSKVEWVDFSSDIDKAW